MNKPAKALLYILYRSKGIKAHRSTFSRGCSTANLTTIKRDKENRKAEKLVIFKSKDLYTTCLVMATTSGRKNIPKLNFSMMIRLG